MSSLGEAIGPQERVDVLIMTAADVECEAVRLVRDGAIGDWQKTDGPPGYGLAVWLSSFETPHGKPLRVALSRAYEQGPSVANAAARVGAEGQ